jgi:hypothetical protein
MLSPFLRLAAAAAIALAAVPASADELMITDPTSWFTFMAKPKPPEQRLPACDASSVESAVRDRIAAAIPSYYDGLEVREITHVEESALVYEVSPLVRRYCVARLELSPPQTRAIVHQLAYYMIEERTGFVGLTWNVEVCLAGRDKWHVYDGNCRTVRPAPPR